MFFSAATAAAVSQLYHIISVTRLFLFVANLQIIKTAMTTTTSSTSTTTTSQSTATTGKIVAVFAFVVALVTQIQYVAILVLYTRKLYLNGQSNNLTDQRK